MLFENRTVAGKQLAAKLREFAGRTDVIVLGIPRGGVPVAFEVAMALKAPLDVFVSRKLGVPGQEELAFGALASGGVRLLDSELIARLGISEQEIEQIATAVGRELERRERVYRGARSPLRVEGKTVLLVDDGIATGSSMRAAVAALKQLKPAFIVVAVPVAPREAGTRLGSEVDRFVCLEMPESFYAIGQFYGDFSQVTDEEVKELLHRSPPVATTPSALASACSVRHAPEEAANRPAEIAGHRRRSQ